MHGRRREQLCAGRGVRGGFGGGEKVRRAAEAGQLEEEVLEAGEEEGGMLPTLLRSADECEGVYIDEGSSDIRGSCLKGQSDSNIRDDFYLNVGKYRFDTFRSIECSSGV